MRVQSPVPGAPADEYESHRLLTLVERLARDRYSEPEIVWEMERLGYTAPTEQREASILRRLKRAFRR